MPRLQNSSAKPASPRRTNWFLVAKIAKYLLNCKIFAKYLQKKCFLWFLLTENSKINRGLHTVLLYNRSLLASPLQVLCKLQTSCHNSISSWKKLFRINPTPLHWHMPQTVDTQKLAAISNIRKPYTNPTLTLHKTWIPEKFRLIDKYLYKM